MCPRCQRASLLPLGAFWICDICGLVIVDQAAAHQPVRPAGTPEAPSAQAPVSGS